MGALQILGALKTTPDNLLDAYIELVPINIRIKKICVRAAACIVVMHESHPLHKPAQKAAKFIRKHCAPIHYILRALRKELKGIEKIDIMRRPPE